MVQDISSISEETAAEPRKSQLLLKNKQQLCISASSQDLAKLAENLSLLVNKFKV